MKYLKKNDDSSGFTIIELLVATLVFSIVLVVILAAFITISRLFYKGVNMSRTQEDARSVLQSITNDIQFSASAPQFQAITTNTRPATGYFCIGLHRYKYQLGYQLGSKAGSGDYAVLRQDIPFGSGCNSTATETNDQEMLDPGMQLNNINVSCNDGICIVKIHVVFYGGTPDIFTSADSNFTHNQYQAPDAECSGSLTDTQYCATADFSSAVLQKY